MPTPTTWVVGARRMRRVDPSWPQEGSEFHHAIGLPGAELHDSTEVLEHVPLHRIVLEVRFRPTGTARRADGRRHRRRNRRDHGGDA